MQLSHRQVSWVAKHVPKTPVTPCNYWRIWTAAPLLSLPLEGAGAGQRASRGILAVAQGVGGVATTHRCGPSDDGLAGRWSDGSKNEKLQTRNKSTQ